MPFASVMFRSLRIPTTHYSGTAPDITLVPRVEGARHGRLWIRSWPQGLYIAGKVDGGPPDFAYTRDQILSKDHVEVWLAGAPDVDLPAIGWGNQFEDVTLKKGAESCAGWVKSDQWAGSQADFDPQKACQEWAASQVRYRPYFKRLFARQWVMTPDFTVEAFATPAFEEIQRWFGGVPDLMKPQGFPQLLRNNPRVYPEPNGYSFQVFIPRSAFPPLPALNATKLYLLVDVFTAAPAGKKMGAESTSSPARVWGQAGHLQLRYRLDPPVSFFVTPCNLPLTGRDKRGEEHPTWILPNPDPAHTDVADTFIVVNDAAGYRYEPEGLSPTVLVTHHFWKSVGKDEWVCGPEMTYTNGGRSFETSSEIGEEGFDTKRLPDGTLLIKDGPRAKYSEFGSGECGACPTGDLRIFALGKDMLPYEALSIGDFVGGWGRPLVSEDISVSPDWSQVTQYDLRGDDEQSSVWSSTTWCLKANRQIDGTEGFIYETCGEKENVRPPDPPVVKENCGS